MGLVLGLLAIPSMFVGYFGRDLFIGLGTDFWGNSLFCLPLNLSIIDAEFMSTSTKIRPLLFSMLGGVLSFILYLIVIITTSYLQQHIGEVRSKI